MIINIPDTVIQTCIEANAIQRYGGIVSSGVRGDQVQRLTVNVGEYVLALIQKELAKTKLLPKPVK